MMKLLTLFIQGDFLTLLLIMTLVGIFRKIVRRTVRIAKKAVVFVLFLGAIGYLTSLFFIH